MTSPAVSVVMAAYNAAEFLREALDSVIAQTSADWELVVVEDGSADDTPAILREYAARDDRVKIVENGRNLGLPESLNRGIAAARSPLIARLDADDVAEPNRLARQLAELDRRPALDLLGSWTAEIDERGRFTGGGFALPDDANLIGWAMTRTNVIYHPTALFRRTAFDAAGGYQAGKAEDYDLFARMLVGGAGVGIVPERLVRYRLSAGQMTRASADAQRADAGAVRHRYTAWASGGIESSADLLANVNLLQVPGPTPPADPAAVERAEGLRRRFASPDVNRRARAAYLHHAAAHRRAGSHDAAAALLRAASACGGPMHPGVLRGRLRATLARLAG